MTATKKRILVRAGMTPLEQLSVEKILFDNLIGNNTGNLLYQYSVFRGLQTIGTELVPNRYKADPNEADYINDTYDAFVIPLANAFKGSYRNGLRTYTRLIKRLKIPVYVIGVGLQALLEANINNRFPFDDEVKGFVKAVLEKSSIIGVRGQITADYLTRLGFKEGRDHTVIGCPSMYTFGRDLTIRDTKITKNSLVYYNSTPIPESRKDEIHLVKFIDRISREFSNHYFVPQEGGELKLVYTGLNQLKKGSRFYPRDMSNPLYTDGRVRMPINVPTWFDMMSRADLSYGARLHGNIAATLAGTPSIMLVKDARMRELAEYHNLTHVNPKSITKDTTLHELIEKVDFKSPTKVHAKNFDHYIDFLNKNDLDNIYKNSNNPKNTPFDKQLRSVELTKPTEPVTSISHDEKNNRLVQYYTEQNLRYRGKIKEQTQEIKKLNNNLNRRSVRLAMKSASVLKKIRK